MKVILVSLALFAVAAFAQHEQGHTHLPEVLIHRARELIHQAEAMLEHHHREGRHHLTHGLQALIAEIKKEEHALMQLEQSRHLEAHHVAEVEERLLHHENRLAEELAAITHNHQREWEENHNREQEAQHNRQREEGGLLGGF